MAFWDYLQNAYKDTVDAGKENWNQFKQNFVNTDWNNVLTKGVSGITGATQILSNGMNAARINDTPNFDFQLDAYNTIGGADYGSNTQIMNGYQNLGYVPQQNYNKVRGMTEEQKLLNTGSGMLSGISTGASIGGLPGAVIGGFAGFIGSKIGQARGDTLAGIKTRTDNLNSQIARNNALMNLQVETEETRDYDFRNAYANRRKTGGQIERKQMNINDFANKVLGTKTAPRVVRTKCKGGVMIKINR